MSSRSESEKLKQIQEKCQVILGNLLREEDNKYCVDCDAKGPRWASWNLGIFLCIRCAGIHRNLGVHISKVKSVNLDTWTPEQVACLQQMGNSQARAVYEANLPDSFRRPQTDSSLEAFIRSKYEQKKYIAKEWVPPPPPKPAFDIEEEKKRQKEKKRTRTKASSSVEIPVLQHPTALPRPHSAVQPSNVLQEPPESVQQKPISSNTADLLSLGDISNQPSTDDVFDAFLSAPQPSDKHVSSPATSAASTEGIPSAGRSYDTTDLFTEMVTPNPVQNKMTKESILSLYGAAQNQPTHQVPSAVYGFTGGMYIGHPSYAEVGLARYTAIPNQPVPNGISGVVPHIAGVQQIQQQMANLQIQGSVWNASGTTVAPVASAGMMVGSDAAATNNVWPTAAHGHSLSTNLWQ